MSSYLSLLDTSCLFEFLSRLPYPDLRNLLSIKPSLYKITNTELFDEEWKKHNIKVVATGVREKIDIDTLGISHGSKYKYNVDNNTLWSREEYFQGKCVSTCEWIRDCVKRVTYVYLGTDTYDIVEYIRVDDSTLITRFMYKNKVRNGVDWEYEDDSIILIDYGSDGKMRYMVAWYPTGELMCMVTKTKTLGWDITGIKRHDISRRHNLNHGPAIAWDERGNHVETIYYKDGLRVN